MIRKSLQLFYYAFNAKLIAFLTGAGLVFYLTHAVVKIDGNLSKPMKTLADQGVGQILDKLPIPKKSLVIEVLPFAGDGANYLQQQIKSQIKTQGRQPIVDQNYFAKALSVFDIRKGTPKTKVSAQAYAQHTEADQVLWGEVQQWHSNAGTDLPMKRFKSESADVANLENIDASNGNPTVNTTPGSNVTEDIDTNIATANADKAAAQISMSVYLINSKGKVAWSDTITHQQQLLTRTERLQQLENTGWFNINGPETAVRKPLFSGFTPKLSRLITPILPIGLLLLIATLIAYALPHVFAPLVEYSYDKNSNLASAALAIFMITVTLLLTLLVSSYMQIDILSKPISMALILVLISSISLWQLNGRYPQ